MMKTIDQKLNKKLLSFIAACLCSTIFLNDSPSWGMDLPPEDGKNNHGRKRSLEQAKNRSAKRQRVGEVEQMEAIRASTVHYISQEFHTQNIWRGMDKLLATTGVHKIINYALTQHGSSIENMRKSLGIAAQELERAYVMQNGWSNQSLKQTIQTLRTLEENPQFLYNDEKTILSIKGMLVGTSDINDELLQHSKLDTIMPTTINAFALNTLFIDEHLTCPESSCNFIAPHWKVLGNRVIDLDGNEGTPVDDDNGHGSRPGNPGGNGGNFYGKANIIDGFDNLTINTAGGRGGKGENGKDGLKVNNPPKRDYGNNPQDGGIFQKYARSGPGNATVYIEGFQYDFGNPGTHGGLGGQGGQGGKILIETMNEKLGNNETKGDHGVPGVGGQGGLRGRHYKEIFLTELKVKPDIYGFVSPIPITHITLDNTHLIKPIYEDSTDRAADGQDGTVAIQPAAPLLQAQGAEFLMDVDHAQHQPLLGETVRKEYMAYYQEQKNQPNMSLFIRECPNLSQHPDPAGEAQQ